MTFRNALQLFSKNFDTGKHSSAETLNKNLLNWRLMITSILFLFDWTFFESVFKFVGVQ